MLVFGETLDIATRENLRESMENQALELCQQYFQDFHGVFDTSMISNTFITADGSNVGMMDPTLG